MSADRKFAIRNSDVRRLATAITQAVYSRSSASATGVASWNFEWL